MAGSRAPGGPGAAVRGMCSSQVCTRDAFVWSAQGVFETRRKAGLRVEGVGEAARARRNAELAEVGSHRSRRTRSVCALAGGRRGDFADVDQHGPIREPGRHHREPRVEPGAGAPPVASQARIVARRGVVKSLEPSAARTALGNRRRFILRSRTISGAGVSWSSEVRICGRAL